MSRRTPTVEPTEQGAPAEAAPAGADAGATRSPALTQREVDVIELATMGLTNNEIAQRLDLSTYAIKFHLSSAYGKLGVANRTQAAVAYLNLRAQGLI